MNKNACEAIRRADRKRRYKTKKAKSIHLTYQLGEVPGFIRIMKMLQR